MINDTAINGTVTFNSKVEGIEFKQFDHVPTSSSIVIRINVTCHERNGITYTVHIDKASSQKEAEESAEAAVVELADRMAFRLGVVEKSVGGDVRNFVVGIGHPARAGCQFNGMIAHSTDLFIAGKIDLEDSQVQDLQGRLDQDTFMGARYLPLFREALNASDPAARFLGLYYILVLITGDPSDQTITDKTIAKYDQNTQNPPRPKPPRPKPPRPGSTSKPGAVVVMESVYTRLRNEFGHDRTKTGATLGSTRSEMESNLVELVKVVKEVIRKGP